MIARTYIILFLSFCYFHRCNAQVIDTLIIEFDDNFKKMSKDNFTEQVQAGAPEEKLKESIMYKIEEPQPEGGFFYINSFTHFNQSQKKYAVFGGEPPLILRKPKSYLKHRKVIDIGFFRTASNREAFKLFQRSVSPDKTLSIFFMDVDEVKNDSVVLREVSYSRPVKQ